MRIIISILTLMVLAFGCGQMDKKSSSNEIVDSTKLGKLDGIGHQINWHDELLTTYISKTDNQLIKLARTDNVEIKWLLDRVEDTDTTKYLIFHIGHSVVDEGNINPRFITDGWVYIDSLTRIIYEYDLPNDKLTKWQN